MSLQHICWILKSFVKHNLKTEFIRSISVTVDAQFFALEHQISRIRKVVSKDCTRHMRRCRN